MRRTCQRTGLVRRGRGLGPQGRGLRDAQRASQLREYVALHHMLGIDNGDRLLDVACEAQAWPSSSSLRGADCAGIDASPRLVAVARHAVRLIWVGDMHALPWDDGRPSGDGLPRDLGNDTGRDRGGLASAAPRRPHSPSTVWVILEARRAPGRSPRSGWRQSPRWPTRPRW